jgi:hypothetical protein
MIECYGHDLNGCQAMSIAGLVECSRLLKQDFDGGALRAMASAAGVARGGAENKARPRRRLAHDRGTRAPVRRGRPWLLGRCRGLSTSASPATRQGPIVPHLFTAIRLLASRAACGRRTWGGAKYIRCKRTNRTKDVLTLAPTYGACRPAHSAGRRRGPRLCSH